MKPHGLRGHVVVELWTNVEQRLRPGTELVAGGGRLTVEASSPLPEGSGRSRWLVTLAGVATREQAEGLRDAVLEAEALEVEGALWIHEMIGGDLYAPDGAVVGRVEAVEANPASDLLVLDDGRVVPLTFVSRAADGRLTVDGPPGLLDP